MTVGCCNDKRQLLGNLGSGEPPCCDRGMSGRVTRFRLFGTLQAGGARVLCTDPPSTLLGTLQLLQDTQGLPAWGPTKLSSPHLGNRPLTLLTVSHAHHAISHFQAFAKVILCADQVLVILPHPVPMPPPSGSHPSIPLSKVLLPPAMRVSFQPPRATPSAFPLQF